MFNIIDAIPENLEIVNNTDLTIEEVTRCVNTVVKLGKISKTKQGDPQYCANTHFEDGVVIFADKNEKRQDRLIVYRRFNTREAVNFLEEIRSMIKEYGFGRGCLSYYDTMSRRLSVDSSC